MLGYFGVIDERLDYELLARLADAFPNGSLVLVGPVVKVDPRELPQATNIHWLGPAAVRELPRYVKGFDVCLMPFALNEATEFINPTKTLEYMAAGKPIVSTAVPDVVRNFTPIVRSPIRSTRSFRQLRRALAPDRLIERAGRGARAERVVVGVDRRSDGPSRIATPFARPTRRS